MPEHVHASRAFCALPDAIKVDEHIELRHLVGLCDICAQILSTVSLYADGERQSVGRWVTNADLVRGSWEAAKQVYPLSDG